MWTYLTGNSDPSTSSQDAAVESLQILSSDTVQCVRLKSSDIVRKFCCSDNEMEFYPGFPYGTMYPPSMDNHGEVTLTLLQEVFPARTYHPPEEERGSEEPDQDSGERWHGYVAKYYPDTSSWKTRQCSLFEDLIESSVTFPKWGIVQDGECWEVDSSSIVQCYERESGFLPAATASDHKRTPHKLSYAERPLTDGIPDDLAKWVVRNSGLDHVRLEPDLWEWIMQWPMMWTALKPLEMDKYLSWLRLLG